MGGITARRARARDRRVVLNAPNGRSGARVIQIEHPGSGDFARAYDERVSGLTSHFVRCNRSKERLTLDVEHDGARDILARANGAPERAGRLVVSLPSQAGRPLWIESNRPRRCRGARSGTRQ